MKKPASLAEAAAIAQFRLAIIAPVIHELYPDSSRNAYYERITEKPFTLPDGSTVRYSPNTISGWVSKNLSQNRGQRGTIEQGRENERKEELPVLDNLGRILGSNQGRYSENGTRPEKEICSCTRAGTQANASEESPGRDILCVTNRLPMESPAPGIWQWKHRTQDVSKVAGSGLF